MTTSLRSGPTSSSSEPKPTEAFDWLAWARTDAQLAAALDDYGLVKQIDDVQIWHRK